MGESVLDEYREVRPDSSFTKVPSVTWDVKVMLNKQTGFNRPLLEASEECGCFHCGRRFPTNLVTSWMIEPGEEDTGQCPYCEEDALIVGTEEHPLTTALLTALYAEWFGDELKERKKAATETPDFKDYDDFFRKGVAFRWEASNSRRLLLEIGIWSVGYRGEDRQDCEGAVEPGIYTDAPLGGMWHLRAWGEDVDDGLTEEEIEALNDDAFWNRVTYVEHYELARGDEIVHFSPWSGGEQATLFELYEEYGDRLTAAFKDPGFSRLTVFVEE